LFSILLPGALLASAGLLKFGDGIGLLIAPLLVDRAAGWVAFLLTAYALGAFVFPLASSFDNWVDERQRQARARRLAAEAAGETYRLIRLPGFSLKLKWRRGGDHAFTAADRLRLVYFGHRGRRSGPKNEPFSTFTWAKTMLMLNAPPALAEVQRFEAESKFFRSMVVVAPVAGLLAAWSWSDHSPSFRLCVVALGLLVGALSFQRYVTRRRKSVEWACAYVVTLQSGPAPKGAAPPKGGAENED